MKKLCLAALFFALLSSTAFGQQLTQTVRGVVLDLDSKLPLAGATVAIPGTEPVIGAITNASGNFRLENVPIGRVALQISYLGYENQVVPNIVVNSGKEVFLELYLQESAVKMNEVVVTLDKNKGEALNDMAIISARSISAEQTNRYAGGFNDPSRILSNFAGITATQDGSNDIIVRGNSPKYVQWRLEGVQMTNPNHFGDQSAVGGSVSILNNNLLATSDFYTGAFAPEYGDALSGVYDVRLRAGNNEKLECVFGFGLLGTEFTVEGPFKKGYGGSFIVNYRYSTAALISDAGLIDVDGVFKFQDATFKVVLPTRKAGTFSLFGLGGLSRLTLNDVTPALWETPGNGAMNPEIREDFQKKAHLFNFGLNHTLSINDNSFLKTTISYSDEAIADDIFESKVIPFFDDEGNHLRDSVLSRRLNFNGKLQKPTYRGAITYHHKINARNKIQVGTNYTLFDFYFRQSQLRGDANERFTLVNMDENVATLCNFVSWKHRLNERFELVSGFHNLNVLLNDQNTFEPRLALNWKTREGCVIHAGYGLHSNMESIHNYFAKVEQPDGSVTEPNRDLGLLKSHHFVLGFEKRFGKNMMAKVEAYYQDLYDLPVENLDTSYYATINEGLEFRYVNLVNKGVGKNYGVEITLEKFFSNNYYYLINASLFESKYKSLEGVWRNTQYNGNYLVNILFGKEFVNLGKRNNQTLGLNAKVFFGGGRKIIPLLRDAQGNLAVEPANGRYWDYEKAYENSIGDVYQVVVSASYKWNKRRATHEIFLNLDNVTNHKGKISEFYDEREPGNVDYLTQFGFFPNLMYRVYF